MKFCLPVLGMLWDVVGNCSFVDSLSDILVVAPSSDWRKLYLAAQVVQPPALDGIRFSL